MKILIADDHGYNREVLRYILEDQGYECVLAVKHGFFGIQPQGQPSGGNFLGGLMNALGLIAFNQGVQVRKKEKRLNVGIVTGCDGRAYSTDIVAQMGSTCSGNAGENPFAGHERA